MILTMTGIENWIIPAALKIILQIGGNGLIWIKNGSGRVALEKKNRGREFVENADGELNPTAGRQCDRCQWQLF